MRPLVLVLSGCMSLSSSGDMEMQEIPDRFVEMALDDSVAEPEGLASGYGKGGGSFGKKEAKARVNGDAPGLMIVRGGAPAEERAASGPSNEPADAGEGARGGGGEDAAALREWFPEAFLWRPSLQTDADGVASLDVRVPDQLTTWRVLALAHDARGHQSGSEHQFDSTLPAYVDPVVPGWSYVGDRFQLPVQVVNNGGSALNASLAVDLSGAMDGGTSASFRLAGFGSRSTRVPVEAVSAGRGMLHADLGGVDQVKKQWTVTPTGRPVVDQHGGTLSGERTLTLDWPSGADPRTAALSVEVQPGPLAVLSAELERLDNGGRWHLAYAYGVLERVEQLSAVVGVELDQPRMDRVRKRAWQRLVKRARSPNALQAAELLTGFGQVEEGSLEAMLKTRLVRTLADGQRGDGTWSRNDRDTLQAVLVTTAAAGRALPDSKTGSRIRTSGALERFEPNIEDAYTAAVAVASGLLDPSEPTLEVLMGGLVPLDPEDPDGTKTVVVPSGVKNLFGQTPSRDEFRAWMTLALLELPDDPERRVLAGDLASQIMTSYSGSVGFGQRGADAILLEAVVAALPTVADPIQLELELGGAVVGTASVDPKQPGVMARMKVDRVDLENRDLVLRSTPASAGLAYTVTQHAWVPWTGSESLPGVDIVVKQGRLEAGIKGRLTYTIAAPSGASVTFVQGLPAGTVIPDVEALRQSKGVASVEVEQNQVEIRTKRFGAGEIHEIRLPVIPRYSGTMRTAPLEVSSAYQSELLPPHVWRVD